MKKILHFIKKLFGYRTFDSIDNLSDYFKDNISELCFWILQNIEWKPDDLDEEIIDEMKTTFGRRWGDCWGMSCICHYCLNKWGWNNYILSAWPKNDEIGHSICVFRNVDKLGYVSNGYLFYLHNNESDEQIAKILYGDKLKYYKVESI